LNLCYDLIVPQFDGIAKRPNERDDKGVIREKERNVRELVLPGALLGPRLIDQAADPVEARDRERDAGIREFGIAHPTEGTRTRNPAHLIIHRCPRSALGSAIGDIACEIVCDAVGVAHADSVSSLASDLL
jgi:hypothetical protein